MMRWVVGALFFCVSLDLSACPLCMGGGVPTSAQMLNALGEVVLAAPTADERSFRVVAVIKGTEPPGSLIEARALQARAAAPTGGKPLLLARDDTWPTWMSLGTIDAKHASWLRQVAVGNRSTFMSPTEWRDRVVAMLPYLGHPEPLADEIAYGEVVAAPYSALLAAKSRLSSRAIRQWLADPKLAERQPLYLLLLGIAGNARDAAALDRRLEATWQVGDATNLAPLIAADLQLRGPSRLAWVDDSYLRDRRRSTREIEATLLALGVHGNANGVIPRARVIQSYRIFMQAHKELAGLVARDFAAWQYWDAVPEYVALMNSETRQQYASRAAMLEYLRHSPGGVEGLERPLPEARASDRSADAVLPTNNPLLSSPPR